MSVIGKTLGHYQINAQLGKGGMGEVFQAKDQVLGRDVAIKVLPEEFARDTDRVARFQREAKVLASLNHPNIAAIHGLEQSEGKNFLVLELVEGQTLADRIKTGPIPVEESLKLALQIAEALEAAHERGIIHRDLKPSNIKVTPDGKVKVLDFGLAKAYAGDREELNLSNSPTLSDAATQQGVILGTAAYMSPEQASGKSIDKRADIWAFGVVLFEMLTGRSLFAGDNVSQTLARVLERQPDFSLLPKNLHFKVVELLKRCLQKESKNRYHDIADIRLDLQEVLADPSGVLVQSFTAAEPRTKLRTILPWAVATLVLGLIIAGVAIWKLKPTEPRQVVRLDYELPEGQQFGNLTLPVLAVSPDGKQFVYSTSKGLYLRSVDELTAKLIVGTEGETQQPFFSLDGKWIGYFSGGKLKKIAINGGAPVALCSVSQLVGASWGADNTIVYGQLFGDIMRVSANGGTPESVVKRKPGMIALGLPQVLPDGKSILYTAFASASQSIISAQSLRSGEPKELFAGVGARYLPTGHLVYAVGNNLLAVPFDPARFETAGGSVPIVEGVYRNITSQFTLSNSGTLVYLPGATGAAAPGRTLVWVDREGKEEALGAPPNVYRHPKLSPDGKRVALTAVIDGNQDIWIWDLLRKTLTRLTFGKANNLQPIWTPDGKKIVFASNREGNYGPYWKSADGTGAEEKLGSMPGLSLLPWSWSSDGKTLITVETDFGSKWNIGMFSMEGERTRKPLLPEEATEINPKISPDGGYMAYVSSESGKNEVYVRPFPDVNKGKWQVSTSGGGDALWSPEGRELFYLSNENSVMAIAVETKPTFSLGTPKTLFRSVNVGAVLGEGTPWDISPDGKRFLMIKEAQLTPSASAGPHKINIVINWFEELRQRVPIK